MPVSRRKETELKLCSYIKHLAEDYGISIKKLEQKCGIGTNSIHNWDKSLPNVLKVHKVAKFFGMTLDEFVKGAQDYEDEQ